MTIKQRIARMSPRARHHTMITLAVGSATAAHYVFAWCAPDLINLSPLAGFVSSLIWIWAD